MAGAPSTAPSRSPSIALSSPPTLAPSLTPTQLPSQSPSVAPSIAPSLTPTGSPSSAPSTAPTQPSSASPSVAPSLMPSSAPSQPSSATLAPSLAPSLTPTQSPSQSPSSAPSIAPSQQSSISPSFAPSLAPTSNPTVAPMVQLNNVLITTFEFCGLSSTPTQQELEHRSAILSSFFSTQFNVDPSFIIVTVTLKDTCSTRRRTLLSSNANTMHVVSTISFSNGAIASTQSSNICTLIGTQFNGLSNCTPLIVAHIPTSSPITPSLTTFDCDQYGGLITNKNGACIPCEPGYYSAAGDSQCIACGSGQIAASRQSATCVECGKHVISRDETRTLCECDIGYHMDDYS
eukprot:55942_1